MCSGEGGEGSECASVCVSVVGIEDAVFHPAWGGRGGRGGR